ncbi:MAG: glycosyltransferase family 2 protein, partial [Ignavibacteria bacterium]|nr:glycosyltransferase family 2 protein [Ignavibacteria bacterium]
MKPKTLIAVVAYNEEKNIRAVLEDLSQQNYGYDIIVIDNSSYDDTLSLCREFGVKAVTHCINSEISGTWKTYFLYSYLNDYDIVCQFDGDGQHIASELPKILNPIYENRANQVVGSRFIERKGFQSFFFR